MRGQICRLCCSASSIIRDPPRLTKGAEIIANTILGVPYCNYRIMGPKTLL